MAEQANCGGKLPVMNDFWKTYGGRNSTGGGRRDQNSWKNSAIFSISATSSAVTVTYSAIPSAVTVTYSTTPDAATDHI